MHIAVTIAVVLLSISFLTILVIAGFKKNGMIWTSIALAMMFVGTIGQNAVLGVYLLKGFRIR